MLYRHKALLWSMWPGVLFSIISTGFYWSYMLLLKPPILMHSYSSTWPYLHLLPLFERCWLKNVVRIPFIKYHISDLSFSFKHTLSAGDRHCGGGYGYCQYLSSTIWLDVTPDLGFNHTWGGGLLVWYFLFCCDVQVLVVALSGWVTCPQATSHNLPEVWCHCWNSMNNAGRRGGRLLHSSLL